MAFKKANFQSKSNPTGDKAFNAITKNVFPTGGDNDGDADDQPQAEQAPKKAATLSGGKSKGSGKQRKYDTATNTFKKV